MKKSRKNFFRLNPYQRFFSFFILSMLILAAVVKVRGVPFMRLTHVWSIGIYAGASPFDMKAPPGVRNPVLKAEDVTDAEAVFLADPFMVQRDRKWFMFFEVLNRTSGKGEIGLAESADGKKWIYRQLVLREPFHLSYPYVFEWENEVFMVPESYQADSVRLYKAVEFPIRWELDTILIPNVILVDSALFRYEERWWIMTTSGGGELRLFYSEQLRGPWKEHPMSPVVENDLSFSRPGGRVLVRDNRIYRFTQDDYPAYGMRVHAFEVTELTPFVYKEKKVRPKAVLRGDGWGWNGQKMHHIDPHPVQENQWLACVDGQGEKWLFGWNY